MLVNVSGLSDYDLMSMSYGKNASRDTPLGEHFRTCHANDTVSDYPLSVKILHRAKDHPNRKTMESLYIRDLKPILNRNISSWFVLQT